MASKAEWHRCRPWIEAALEYAGGTHTIEDVEAGIGAGRYQFWAGENAAIVTEIITYPRLKALHYWLIGGSLKELKDMERRISRWAKEELGCSRATGIGRKGFERAFQGEGYRFAWTCIVREL